MNGQPDPALAEQGGVVDGHRAPLCAPHLSPSIPSGSGVFVRWGSPIEASMQKIRSQFEHPLDLDLHTIRCRRTTGGAHASRRGDPIDLGYALTTGAHEFDHRCGHDDLHKRAEECERLGRENSLPVLWALMAPIARGQALIREGKVAEAIAALKVGIVCWEASGGNLGF
jgi:hypothetical protein